MEGKYNLNSSAVKRILREAKEFDQDPPDGFIASPLDDNIFEWHFTFRGPSATEFEGGVYHGRIVLPTEYPFKPPDIILLTPNGRFEIGKKICLTVSAHHPECWQPSWSIRNILVALIAFMPTPAEGAVASLEYTPEERKVLAKRSLDFTCKQCGVCNRTAVPESTSAKKTSAQDEEVLRAFQAAASHEAVKRSAGIADTPPTSPQPSPQILPAAARNLDLPASPVITAAAPPQTPLVPPAQQQPTPAPAEVTPVTQAPVPAAVVTPAVQAPAMVRPTVPQTRSVLDYLIAVLVVALAALVANKFVFQWVP